MVILAAGFFIYFHFCKFRDILIENDAYICPIKQTETMKTTKTFWELLAESHEGNFVVSVNNGLIEIKVNYSDCQIVMEHFRTLGELTPYKKNSFTSLHGMFGHHTVESKFNQLMEVFI